MAVRAHEELRLTLGVPRADHRVHASDGFGLVARPGENPVTRDDVVDRRGEHRARCDRMTMWSQTRSRSATMCDESSDGHAGLGDLLHHSAHELAACQRVERCDRLVENQELGALRECERECDLRLLAARELADLLVERQAEPLDAPARRLPSQVGLSLRPSSSVSPIVKPRWSG